MVTAASYKDELAIVTHISPPLSTDEQVVLKYSFDGPFDENSEHHVSVYESLRPEINC